MARHHPPKGISYRRALLGYDIVHFTRHALDRLRERSVRREDVYKTVESPDETGLPTQPGRIRVRRKFGEKKSLDVVYELFDDGVQIITTFWVVSEVAKGHPPKIVRVKPSAKTKRK